MYLGIPILRGKLISQERGFLKRGHSIQMLYKILPNKVVGGGWGGGGKLLIWGNTTIPRNLDTISRTAIEILKDRNKMP